MDDITKIETDDSLSRLKHVLEKIFSVLQQVIRSIMLFAPSKILEELESDS